MQLTKGAIGNLINRYKAVLKKCHLMNTFGSLAVAGMLVMGGAGVATAAGDMALGGGSLEWSGDADHLMGGNLYKGNVTVPEVTTPGDISLSIKGGTIEEIIGGSYVSGNNDQVGNVTLGNISTTIQDGSSTEFVVGGSKISNDVNATLATGKTSLTINGGTFGKEGENDGYELVMGGNYVKTGTDTKNTASAEGSRVTVNDGIFHASVVGGSVAHRYNGNNSIMVEDNGSTSVVIKGGTFSPSQSNIADNNGGINLTAAVIGGGLAYGGGSSVLGSRDNPVTSSVTINGGTFKPEANGHYAKIVAGSVVANNGGTAIVHGNTTLAMAGGTAHDDLIGGGMVENAATLPKDSTSSYNLNITGDSSVKVTSGSNALGEVIGGNYVKTSTAGLKNSAKVANSSVTITGGTFADVDDSTNKAQYIIGGSKTNASGGGNATTLVEGNSSVLIDGDVTIEDGALIGGSQAKAGNGQSEATATVTGNSSVTVNKGTLAGVIGGGIAETYYTTAIAKSTVDGTSFVAINGGNVTGNSIETGAVAGNTGTLSAAVVGGGLANDKGSAATVGSTRVTIADGTINGKVVAGGAAVNGGSSTVTHDTSLTMTGGKVDGDLIGGGFVDMNNATDNKANVGGSTHITVSGGSLVDAEIIGGGSVRNATGEANVTGDTHVTVTKYANDQVDQQWVQYVLGGGKAMTSKNGQTATAKVAGSTNVTIGEQGATGEALKIEFGTVAGGGLARAQAASSTATANVNNANVTVHSGILFGVAGGGIAESYNTGTADATVTNANLTINGGTINGVEYKGVDTDKVKVAVLGGGIAKGTKATANATTTNTVINGGKINGHVVAGGLADGGTATVGTANVTNANLTINGGEINGSVYAGGAALNSGTATVENFDVRITGGNITGDVVAGDYTGETPETKAVVLKTSPSKGTAGKGGTITIGGDATIGGKVDASAGGVATNVVIDGADATVTGGYEGNKDSTLTFNNYDDKFDNVAYGFGTLNVAEGSNVRMDAVVSGKQGTAPEDPQTGFFGARHDAEGSSNPITITGGGTITAKQFHVSTNADVTIAHGNVVADDVQVQSATLKVGGESTSASLTVNEELIIDKTHPGNQNIDVENLGTLTLGKNIVLDENGELKAEYLDTVPSHVKAGGTLKINGLDGKTLTDKELASLQGLLNSNIPDIPPGEGLLDLGGADLGEVEPNADGTVSYANVAGITTDSLKDTTVTVTDEQNAAGISGGFQAVKLTGADTELNAKGTLVLAGSQNGDNLVIDTKGAVADLRVGGAYATRDTSAVTLGLADANNSGTVGTVTLNAGTDNKATLNVIGAGAAEFKVGDIRANESTNTINVAGATLKTGNITTESGTKALDKLNITSGIVNASGNVNITDVALANGVLTANKVPATAEGVPATGDITLGTLSGQGAVVADNALTVTNDYNGADTDALGLQADTLTTAAFNSTKGDVAIKASQWNASGTTTLKGDTVVLTEAGTFTGAFTMDGGTLVAQSGDDANLATLTFKDDATFTNGAVTVVDSIKMNGTTNKTLTVGTDDDKVGGTTLSAQHIDLNDGMLLVDPAWNKASSNVAVASMGTPTPSSTTDVVLDGSVGVGQNSYLALGTADTGWLPGVVGNYTKGVGLSQDGITAALGVFKGIEIADGKGLVVDGGLTGTASGEPLHDAVSAATNTAEFAKNSLLVVNGANIYGDKAAIKFAAASGGTLTVDKTSKLLVTDAVAGQDYTIVDNVTTVQDGTSTAIAPDETVWKTEGLSTTTDMISLGDAKFDGTNKVTTSAVRNDAHTVFPNLSDGMANAVNDLYTGHDGAAGEPRWDYADVNSADMGVRFLSRATDNRFLGADKDAAAATIESAARIAFAGAVPQMTKMASDAGSNAVVNRLGFANPADGAQAMDAEGKIVDRNTTGFALWIAPLWQSQHGWGMEADNLDYGFNGNLGGVSLGADYTFENAIRAGITFNIGGGYAESSGGDLNSTENRMSFWGLGAYAGWNYENFGLMADVSYTSTWNDLKQDMDSRMGMGDLEADVQASAISAGLRAEYKLETSVLDVIPHIGVRYMSLNTWGFDAESNGGTVLEGDGFHQDIWTFPVGVTFTKDFTLDSGWSFKPSVDFSVIPAAGDIKAKQDVAFTGLPGSYEVETQMMDYLTWQGGVGLEMGNDTMSFGVNYTLQAGQHTTGHGVFGSFRYEF